MSSQDVFPLSAEKRAQGYGRFPYLILRINSGVYMQFPIHFYTTEIPDLPGLRVCVADTEHEKNNFSSLFGVVQRFNAQINPVDKTIFKLCLVLTPRLAYFFEVRCFTLSEDIPFGGSLINSEYKVLALNSAHFLTD